MKYLNNFTYHLMGIGIMLVVYVIIGYQYLLQKIHTNKLK